MATRCCCNDGRTPDTWTDWSVGAAGHVEAGESVLQAACREAREELDVLIEPHDLVPLTGMHRTGGGTDPLDERVDFFFECRRWQGTPRLTEPTRTAAVEWFPLDALPDPVVPHELFVLETLRAGLAAPITTFGF